MVEPNSVLIYRVELLEVKEPGKPASSEQVEPKK